MHLLALYICSFSFPKKRYKNENSFTQKKFGGKFNVKYIEKSIF